MVKEITVTPADSYIILASDGLWDVVSNEEATKLVLDTICVLEGSDKLMKLALHKGSGDNVTTAVVGLRWNVEQNYESQYLNDLTSSKDSEDICSLDTLEVQKLTNSPSVPNMKRKGTLDTPLKVKKRKRKSMLKDTF